MAFRQTRENMDGRSLERGVEHYGSDHTVRDASDATGSNLLGVSQQDISFRLPRLMNDFAAAGIGIDGGGSPCGYDGGKSPLSRDSDGAGDGGSNLLGADGAESPLELTGAGPPARLAAGWRQGPPWS